MIVSRTSVLKLRHDYESSTPLAFYNPSSSILHEDTLIPDMYSNPYLDPNLCVSKKGVCPSTGPNDPQKTFGRPPQLAEQVLGRNLLTPDQTDL